MPVDEFTLKGLHIIDMRLDPTDARVCDSCNDVVIAFNDCGDGVDGFTCTEKHHHNSLQCVQTCYSIDQMGELWCATCYLKYLSKDKSLTYQIFRVGDKIIADREGHLTVVTIELVE